MGRIVIVAYKPFPGKAAALEKLIQGHWAILHQEGLVTDRQSVLCKAADGTIIEIFEWRSAEAIELAHSNAAVQQMWSEYAEVCDYVPVGEVKECQTLFSEFTPF